MVYRIDAVMEFNLRRLIYSVSLKGSPPAMLTALINDCPNTPRSCRCKIPAVTQNPLSIVTIFPVLWMGTVISHMREEVFVYFLPLVAFFPSKADGNAHLPV